MGQSEPNLDPPQLALPLEKQAGPKQLAAKQTRAIAKIGQEGAAAFLS